MSTLTKRYDFVYLFDCKDGNPNGDPDFANTPRFDPETFQGLVSDVCLKRKIRDYVFALKSQSGTVESGYDVFIMQGGSLENRQKLPYTDLKIEAKTTDKIKQAREWMCKNFFDVRAFGAVMSTTDFNCGQVRGPVQITFARSIDRVLSTEHGITRVVHTTNKDQDSKGKTGAGTMGNKHTIAYGLYRTQGFINATFAKDTGFTEADLGVLWKALANMFDHDRSAARGLMAPRHLFVFEHDSALGEAPAHKLFDAVKVERKAGIEAPRSFEDYTVTALADVKTVVAKFPGVNVCDKLNP
ncbi:MAG: type I-C CRISPR-associated protein Cas7/Csd2 [Planctomycetota bacterium]